MTAKHVTLVNRTIEKGVNMVLDLWTTYVWPRPRHVYTRRCHRDAEKHKEDFQECSECAAKPGSPILCSSCLHNRRLIANLKR